MKFQEGQKVLCVDDHFTYCAYRLKKGSIYTINGFYICACGSHQVTLVEIPDVVDMGCRCHRTSIRRQSYYNWRFVPLECSEIFSELSDLVEDAEVINFQSEELQNEFLSSKYRTKY